MGAYVRHEGGFTAARTRGSLRWTGLALIAALLLCVGLSLAPSRASAADSVYVDYPPQGGVFNGPPYDYMGRAFPDVFPLPPVYLPQVTGAVQAETSPGVYGGPICKGGTLGMCGIYHWRTVLDTFGEDWKASDSETVVNPGANSFADGNYRVRVGQASGIGLDPLWAENYFHVDSTEPTTAIDLGPNLYNNNAAATMHFEFSGTDPVVNNYASGIDYFNCKLDNGPWDHCTAPGGSAPYTYDLIASEGAHTLYVRAVDKANNEDASPAEHSWIIDETPPDITINKPLNKDRYLLHNGPNPIFSCVDPLAGSPPGASGIASCTATPINDEDLGPHYFTVTAIDKAGNTSQKTVAYTIDPPDYGDFVMESHPLAYYRFNEALGSDVMVDSSGNGHNGIYQNGIALQRDGATNCERRPHPPRVCELAHPAENKAAYFPARDGHGYVNGITAPTTAYTMEAWVKPRDGANMMVMSHGGGGQLFISGGNLAFRQVQDTIYSNGAVPPGVWSHVAATWNGSVTRLYVNGILVASSTTANKPPSGTATFYIGYGEMAPWFHGDMDEAAYYSTALSQHRIFDRWKVGVAKDNPSLVAGNSPFNTEGPATDPDSPKNGGLYAPGKTPHADFDCHDPDDLPGDSDIASCTATVDGNPILSGDPLPDSPGVHTFVVTAIDEGGNTYVHTHTYTVKTFKDLFNTDGPVAYYRLGDGPGPVMADSSGNGRNGEYKNAQDSGPLGISGDGDHARNFFGTSGYGFVNGIAAPRFQSTLEAWVKPLGDPDPVSTDFVGGSNPAGWSVQNIWNPGGTAGVSDNVLYADGASFGTNATFGSGRTVNFVANIPAEPYSHAGFGADYNNPPWAMFSVKGDGRLYARTSNGVDPAVETDLGTGYLGSNHRYTIDWHADRLVYYVDGDPVAVHAVSFGPVQMRPLISNYSAGGASVAVDWLRLSPYANRNQSIVGHGDGGEIYIKDGYFVYRRMDTSVTSSVAVRPGEWQQVVGTWDGVDIRIYVDGVEAGKVESTKRPSSVSTFYVGYGELAPWFNGSIDEVAYYPVALNTNRVFQHWLADPPPDDLNAATNGVQPDDVSDIHPTPGAGGGTDPSGTSDEPKSDDPGSSDPGSGDPDNPTSDDPSTDDPSGDPGEGADDGTVEPIYEKSDKPKAAANRSKAAKAKKRRAAVRKCKKISKKSKRKACLKRARSI